MQNIDQTSLTEALREAAGIGHRDELAQDMLPYNGGEALAEARGALRTPPPGTTSPPDKTLRPPPSCPTHPVRVVASFESEVVFPVGTESCVSANQIETKISRRNSTTHTDNTATDADTHDHTPTDDTAAATELGRPPPTETPPLPPETPPALPQPPPEEAAATPHRPPPAPVTATHGGGGGADPPPTPDIHTPALRPAARRDPPMSPTAAGSDPPLPAKPHRAAPRRLWGDYSEDDDGDGADPHAHDAAPDAPARPAVKASPAPAQRTPPRRKRRARPHGRARPAVAH